ncbi:MAG: hypothetical protein F4207_01950 [Gemmatimonadetes bacterium]|nr:hypothetical protein [Gemmatimonadota bacterium]MYG15178.1 hypothetical protein [Gemmatimonadota bacterium]
MDRPIVNPGRLHWTGQHWINYIRPPNAGENSAMVSLWHTHYCSAGEGTVAYVLIEHGSSYRRICTDNPDLAAFIRNWMSGRGGMYDMELEVVPAVFTRSGNVLDTPAWTIETADDLVIARWDGLQPPELLDAPGPGLREGWDVFSCLFFARSARIMFNGHLIPGEPFPVDTWKPSIGGERSSCVFALSETFIQAAGQNEGTPIPRRRR